VALAADAAAPAGNNLGLHPVGANGLDLLSMLEKHQTVKMHAMVKAAEYDAPMNVVVATIPGDRSTNEEFHFTAHLFEGIAKQGANGNCGAGDQLEAGRAWIEMIKDGTLPKPKRTVRFLRFGISGRRRTCARIPSSVSMSSRASRPIWSARIRRSITTRCT
jgi:hypothetical protein